MGAWGWEVVKSNVLCSTKISLVLRFVKSFKRFRDSANQQASNRETQAKPVISSFSFVKVPIFLRISRRKVVAEIHRTP